MKVWFEIYPRYRKVGVITDVFCDYLELKEVESGEYFIRHWSKCEIIKQNGKN